MTKVFSGLLCILFATLSASSADPGGWDSSGGEIFRFAKNPWFLKNVSVVKYCVSIDPVGFSAKPDVARAAIQYAIDYWRREFDYSMTNVQEKNSPIARIATQTFVEEACSDTTDLTVKFGDGVLSGEEKDWLKDFRSYIGITVRKAYDTKLMKGHGFIFIASDQGANPYRNPGHLIDRAWQYPKLLNFILLHEFGHVFGLPHAGTGLMSEVFADQLLHKNMYKAFMSLDPPSMFGSPRGLQLCPPFGAFEPGFFQSVMGKPCLQIDPTPADPYLWDISSTIPGGTPELIGHLRVQPSAGAEMSLQPALIVQLTPDQEVFAPEERAMFNFLVGAFYVDMNAGGIYRTVKSVKPYPVFLQMRPDRLNILGEFNGQLSTLLEYSPPTLFKLLFPPKGKN
jgi:hypothetical protein